MTCGRILLRCSVRTQNPLYMGYLVLQSADNRAFDIIDGPQRMTTLSLLMLAAVAI